MQTTCEGFELLAQTPDVACQMPALLGSRYCVLHATPAHWLASQLPLCLCAECNGTPDGHPLLCPACYENFMAAGGGPVSGWLAGLVSASIEDNHDEPVPDEAPFRLTFFDRNDLARLLLDAILRAPVLVQSGRIVLPMRALFQSLAVQKAAVPHIAFHDEAFCLEISLAEPPARTVATHCGRCHLAANMKRPLVPMPGIWLCIPCANQATPPAAPPR